MSELQKKLPNNWTVVQMSDIAQINPGRSFDLPGSAKITFLAMPDVTEEGEIINRQEKTLEEVKSGFTHFADGDVLVAKITPCFENGKGAFVDGMINGVGFGSTEFHVIRPFDSADQEFIFYHTTSHEFRARGELHMVGSAGQKRVPATYLREYTFGFPPEQERKRITNALRTWDDAIALQSRQLQQLYQRKEVLYSELLTGGKRLPGFSDEWKSGLLGDYFSERVERGDLELPLLAITANQGIVRRDTLEKRDTSNEDKSKYKRIRVGDIGYNTMRMWQGVSALSALDGIVSPAYTILKPLANCDAEFMAHLFKWPPMIHAFKRHSQGLVDDTLLCKYDSFRRISVKAPVVIEQRAIAEVLNTVDTEIRLHKRKLDVLREQKRGLLQKLLTGEILLS